MSIHVTVIIFFLTLDNISKRLNYGNHHQGKYTNVHDSIEGPIENKVSKKVSEQNTENKTCSIL